MKLDLDRLPDGHFELPVSQEMKLEGLEEGPTTVMVEGSLRVDKLETRVVVVGRLEAVETATCDRCLREFPLRVEVPLEVLILRDGGQEPPEEREPSLIHQESGEVDLDEALNEAVALAQPLQRLCRPDCPGLCPRCGADLSAGPCGCEPEPDSRWDDLPEL